MDMWQLKAANKMEGLINNLIQTKKIEYTGSMLAPETLDVCSDVDMNVYLPADTGFEMETLINKLKDRYDSVFGYETHVYAMKNVLRICFRNGHRYDISFIYTDTINKSEKPETYETAINRTVNLFWHIASQALAKLGRDDHLVAAHLVLELCQLTIVIQMLERDRKKGTDRHRRGDKEDVPIIHSLRSLDHTDGPLNNNTADAIINIMFAAAKRMDVIAEALDASYTRRTAILDKFRVNFKLPAPNEPQATEDSTCI